MSLLRFLTSASKKSALAATVREAAQRGDASAQVRLGSLYEFGNGVPQDDAQAVVWYRKAAEQGNVNGQWALGCQYENGHGVPLDYAEAALWYRKAAEQGDAGAQQGLGGLYEFGHGVQQDYVEAYFWYSLAASGFRLVNLRDEATLCREQRDNAAALLTPVERSSVRKRMQKWAEDHSAKQKVQ